MQLKKKKRKKGDATYAKKLRVQGIPMQYSSEYRAWKARVMDRKDSSLEHYAWKKKHGPDNWRHQ